MDIKNLNDVPAFITKDGSEIRELLAHRNSGIRNQSLAEARLPIPPATRSPRRSHMPLHLLRSHFGAPTAACAPKKAAKFGRVPGPSPAATADKHIVKPSDVLTGKVVSFNPVGRFAVLN